MVACCTCVAISLAYPLLWCHVYIPVLPRTLVQVLQAPMPFIVGISSKTYALVHVPSHVVRVELDHNKVACGTPIVPLPPKQRTKLLRELRKCANAYVGGWASHCQCMCMCTTAPPPLTRPPALSCLGAQVRPPCMGLGHA